MKTMPFKLSIINYQFTLNYQYSMINEKLLKIENWKLEIAPEGSQ